MWDDDAMDTANLEAAARRYRDTEAALDAARTNLQAEAVTFLQQHDERGSQATAARITGWSREHIRNLWKKAEEGAERSRREAEVEALRRKVEELSTAKEPSPAAAPRYQATETLPDDPTPEPPEHVGVSPEVAVLSYDEAQDLFRDAETRNIQWAFRMRRTLGTVPPGRRPYLGVQAGVDEGLITLPERPVSGEETNG